MELEVGMYVRTKKGIAKIKTLDDLDNVAWTDNKDIFFGIIRPNEKLHFELYDDGTVLKASNNIIDLIEAGDILEINNEKYEVIYDESYEKLGILIPSRKELSIRHSALEYIFKKYKVSIVTKEQFSSMEYRLGDE